jgi:hypothetical protein
MPRKIAADGEDATPEHDNMVKTFPPDRTDRPFTISILPRRIAVRLADPECPSPEGGG